MKVDRIHCPECDAVRKCSTPGTNHTFHVIMSLFTLGIWPLFWVGAAMSNTWTCDTCGEDVTGAMKRVRRKRNNSNRWAAVGRIVKVAAYGGLGLVALTVCLAVLGAVLK